MKRMNTRSLVVLALLASVTSAFAAEPAQRPQTDTEKKAADFLAKTQDKDGAWMPQAGPAVTAMVVRGLVQAGRPIDDPVVAKGLAFIETFRQDDGSYYKDSRPNYNTSLVLSMFASLPGDAYKAKIAKAQEYLKSIQSGEGKTDDKNAPITKDHSWYGGTGYAGTGAKRPDLSNTSYFMDALMDSGTKADDPAIQKALVFVSRCQMNAETNDQTFAKGQSSGGFIYSTHGGGESMMGTTEREGNEVLVAYGSMTYAGLKSFIYAGLTKDDPRVKAAWKWITANWTLDVNPGTSKQDGLFYYYHTFAKALQVYGEDTITDFKGVKHDWHEFNEKLATLQKPDGSFINDKSERWMEGNPILPTAYALLALQEARK